MKIGLTSDFTTLNRNLHVGKRGPPPKSSVIRELEGTHTHNKSTTTNTALPVTRGKPVCPAHLGEYEKEVWRRIVRSVPPKLYGEIDSVILSAYCVAAGLHREAVLKMAIEGVVQIGSGGSLMQSPWVLVLQKQVQTISSLGSKLGLDPAARMNLGSTEEKPASKFGDLLTIEQDQTE